MFASAYRYLTADQLVNEGPTLLTGYSLNASADGGDVTIYDGLDTASGNKVLELQGLAAVTFAACFESPVLFNNGLYVDIGSNVTSITLFYIPLRGGSPLMPYPGFSFPPLEG